MREDCVVRHAEVLKMWELTPGVPILLHHAGRVGPAALPGLAGAAVAVRLERGDDPAVSHRRESFSPGSCTISHASPPSPSTMALSPSETLLGGEKSIADCLGAHGDWNDLFDQQQDFVPAMLTECQINPGSPSKFVGPPGFLEGLITKATSCWNGWWRDVLKSSRLGRPHNIG